MLFQQTRAVSLSPSASLIHGVQLFLDHSLVIIQLNLRDKTTTFRFFCPDDPCTQKHIISFPRILLKFGSVIDKELFVVDINQGQIIVLDFYKDGMVKTIHQCQNLKRPKAAFNICTFLDTSSFAVNIQDQSKRDILYYKYPAEFVHQETVETGKRKVVKVNERGDIGLFNPQFETFFKVSIINIPSRTTEEFSIPIPDITTVRSIHKPFKDTLVFLTSNNQSILSYEISTNTLSDLACIKDPVFGTAHLQPKLNVIFDWIPLEEYICIITRNTGEKAHAMIHLVNYQGKYLDSHRGFIDEQHYYHSNRGKRYYEGEYSFRGAERVSIREIEVVPHRNMICYLAEKGLGLSEEMVETVVNAIDYSK